jgi:hypothetical protein
MYCFVIIPLSNLPLHISSDYSITHLNEYVAVLRGGLEVKVLVEDLGLLVQQQQGEENHDIFICTSSLTAGV